MRDLLKLFFGWFINLDRRWQRNISLALIALGAAACAGTSSEGGILLIVAGLAGLAFWTFTD